MIYHHHHHHIRFWYLWCCGCPGLRGRQHLATPHTDTSMIFASCQLAKIILCISGFFISTQITRITQRHSVHAFYNFYTFIKVEYQPN